MSQTHTLIGPYTYRELVVEEFAPLVQNHLGEVFGRTSLLSRGYAYSDTERAALQPLRRNLEGAYTLHLGVYQGEAFVGWHTGQQTEADQFYMTNTGVLQEHRRNGIYTALLGVVLGIASDKGFQEVYSRHTLTNNAVIIPKLKAGFVISGFELNDRYGALARLSYFFNPLRRKVMDFRAGQLVLDDELRTLLS